MADDGRLPLELADGVDVVIGGLFDALVCKDLWVVMGPCYVLWIIGPAEGEGRIALLFEEGTPGVPTGCEEPEAVDKDDRL
jgi:hypothetical protein